jgi:Saxitoxin biosynthesis operon protein SxtJ
MEIHWYPNNRQLRQFSILCMLLSAILFVRGSLQHAAFPAFITAAAVFLLGLAGLLKPAFLRPLYVGWMIAVFPIGWMVSKLILAALFYGVFTPIGLCFRLLGRDALGLKRQPGRVSYWIPKETPDDPRRYLQQF